ncbi:hypothetical protein GCM10010385_03990 [Streptomyces geysiriensis]|nr:hypothetical protein GCM10010385_03990 [Streptomyces geysiriensis]
MGLWCTWGPKQVDQGIAGLAGATLGGLIGVVGTLASARLTGRDQRRTQHEHWRRQQQQRDAYSQLVTLTTEAISKDPEATDAYIDRESSAESLSEQFSKAVRQTDKAESLVILEGPEEAANAAMELTSSLSVWANVLELSLAVDSGTYVPMSGEPPLNASELDPEERKEKTYQCSDDFILTCRRLLDT